MMRTLITANLSVRESSTPGAYAGTLWLVISHDKR
jgi:hypothetical protein